MRTFLSILTIGFALVTARGELIPAAYLASWEPGTDVGVAGGIDQYIAARTNLIDVTQSPYNADNTGTNDCASAINSAISAATTNDVVYLPAGTYRINSGISVGTKDSITIRGDGNSTVIMSYATSGNALYVGSGSAWNWSWPSSGYEITGGGTKASDTVAIADTSAYSVGDLIRFASDNDQDLPVVANQGWNGSRRQVSIITSKTGTDLTYTPPLMFALGSNPTVRVATHHSKYVGIEDLTLDCTNAASGATTAVMVEQAFNCWLSGVKVISAVNYSIYINNSLNIEVRRCYVDEIQNAGSNGAGLLLERSTACLVEDNIFYKAFPLIEVNHGSTGNVIAFNFCENSETGTLIGVGIDTNHGPHNSYNLYEGNIVSKIQSDGYFGGASEDTIFRNWAHGSSPINTLFAICINLNRFSRNYNIVANVLGVTDFTFDFYDNGGGVGSDYADRYIYGLGWPNMGNMGATGTAEPSTGDDWADWSDYLSALALNNGSGPGPSGFQELDLDVANTVIRKGNWNAIDEGIRAAEVTADTVPDSYFRSSKPSYFEGLAWPAIGPERVGDTFSATVSSLSTVAIIPAQARFYSLTIPPSQQVRRSPSRAARTGALPFLP